MTKVSAVLATYEAVRPSLSKSPSSKSSDAEIDEAVETWARLDTFFRATSLEDPKTTFATDGLCIKPTFLTGPEQP